jgi:hypothetical protein
MPEKTVKRRLQDVTPRSPPAGWYLNSSLNSGRRGDIGGNHRPARDGNCRRPCDNPGNPNTPTGTRLKSILLAEEIQLLTCGYSAQCTVRGCRARATMIARYTDGQGRPQKQRELCERHPDLYPTQEASRIFMSRCFPSSITVQPEIAHFHVTESYKSKSRY